MKALSPEMLAMYLRIQRAGPIGYYFPATEYRTAKALERRGEITIEGRCVARIKEGKL